MIRTDDVQYLYDYGVHSQTLIPVIRIPHLYVYQQNHQLHVHALQCYNLYSKRFFQKHVFPLFHPILCQRCTLTIQKAT